MRVPGGRLTLALIGVMLALGASAAVATASDTLQMLELPIPTARSGATYAAAESAGLVDTIWFSESSVNRLGALDRVSQRFREFKIPTTNAHPIGISVAPKCHTTAFDHLGCFIWFAETQAGKLGRAAPDGSMVETALSTAGSGDSSGNVAVALHPLDVAVVDSGQACFTDFISGRIGCVENSVTRILPAATGSALMLKPDRGGSLWFTSCCSAGIGHINPANVSGGPSQQVKGIEFDERDLFTDIMPARLSVGYDGSIWFTRSWLINRGDSLIGRLSPEGKVTYVTIPTTNGGPADLTTGLLGDIWFTEYKANKIGVILQSGQVKEYAIPTPDSGPLGITTISGGIAFVEHKANKIGIIWLKALHSAP